MTTAAQEVSEMKIVGVETDEESYVPVMGFNLATALEAFLAQRFRYGTARRKDGKIIGEYPESDWQPRAPTLIMDLVNGAVGALSGKDAWKQSCEEEKFRGTVLAGKIVRAVVLEEGSLPESKLYGVSIRNPQDLNDPHDDLCLSDYLAVSFKVRSLTVMVQTEPVIGIDENGNDKPMADELCVDFSVVAERLNQIFKHRWPWSRLKGDKLCERLESNYRFDLSRPEGPSVSVYSDRQLSVTIYPLGSKPFLAREDFGVRIRNNWHFDCDRVYGTIDKDSSDPGKLCTSGFKIVIASRKSELQSLTPELVIRARQLAGQIVAAFQP